LSIVVLLVTKNIPKNQITLSNVPVDVKLNLINMTAQTDLENLFPGIILIRGYQKMSKTNIQWAANRKEGGEVEKGFTLNPLAGCTQKSPGCAKCYAKTLHDMRHKLYLENNGIWPVTGKQMPIQYALPFGVIQLFPERWAGVLSRKAPTVYFVNSMSDMFHEDVALDFIKHSFDVMNRAHWHTFQILTKREERLAAIADSGLVHWSDNIWQGVSIENDRFTFRADYLRHVPSAVRFLSCEPLLSDLPSLNLAGIDWLIAGAESGPPINGKKPKPMDLLWVRNLRDKCLQSGTAFFLKQFVDKDGKKIGLPELDGRQWVEMPTARAAVPKEGQQAMF
jgi:protein gp37